MAPAPTPPAAATPPPPQDAEPPEVVQAPDAVAPPPAPDADSSAPAPYTDAPAAPLPDAEAPKPDRPAAPLPDADSTPPQAHLPEGILEDIFLRLPTAGDVARATAACAAFRAITAGQPFRRRYRALHRAPVLGFLREDFYPAQAPHPSAPAARALAHAADFAFTFLPGDADCWSPRDARDGRVLFSAVPGSHGRGSFADATSTTFVDLVVADPLSRRCARVPPVPDDLASPVMCLGMLDFEPFLAPATAEDLRAEDAPFRVIGKVLCEDRVTVFAFSSRTGEWRCHGSSDLSNDFALDALYERRHYVQGCFCWLLEWMEKLLMLDAGTMEFSIADLPPGNDERRFAILEAGQGRIGLLNIGRNTLDLYYTAWPSKRRDAREWQHETKEHPLPDYHWRIIGSDEEYLLLRGISLDWPWFGSASSESPDIEYFALELKALQLERMYVSKHKMLHAHLYRGYPPQISAPTL